MTVNRISHLATSDHSDFLSAEIGAEHFETSSKTGSNVGELCPQPCQKLFQSWGGCIIVGTHFSHLMTDEMFQKLAEDYTNSALQHMTGQ